MGNLNIVTNYKISQVLKRSKYCKIQLGFASTAVDSISGERIMSPNDDFAYFYNKTYNTTIYMQYKIGNIGIYFDSYINDDKLAFYFDKEEFVFDFDNSLVEERGVDFYLGHLIKITEEEKSQRSKEEKVGDKKQIDYIPNPDNVLTNPGQATYSDILAYIEKKKSERLKN